MKDSGDGDDDPVRIALAPAGDFFARGSTAWNDELNDFYREVDRELADAIERPSGYRGPVAAGEIILALVTSGTLTALLGCVRAWIARAPRRRRLELRVETGKTERRLVIDAENVDDATLLAAVRGSLKSGR